MVHRFIKRKVETVWGDVMKEKIKNLLILLSTPIYLLVGIVLCIIWASQKVGEKISELMSEWINFMKDDYKKVYEVIKNDSNKRKHKKEVTKKRKHLL